MYTFKDIIVLVWNRSEVTIESSLEGRDSVPTLDYKDIPEFIEMLQRVYKACEIVERRIEAKKNQTS